MGLLCLTMCRIGYGTMGWGRFHAATPRALYSRRRQLATLMLCPCFMLLLMINALLQQCLVSLITSLPLCGGTSGTVRGRAAVGGERGRPAGHTCHPCWT